MRCKAFQGRLNDLLDRRQPPNKDRALIRHARRCQACSELLQMNVLVVRALQGEQPVVTRTSRAAFELPTLLLHVAVAASVLAILAWWLPTLESVPSSRQLANRSNPPRSGASDSGHGDQSLPGTSVYQPLIGLSLLSRTDWSLAADETNMSFAPPLAEFESAWKVVEDGMTPVRRSVNGTFDLIRRSLVGSSRSVVNG